MKRALLLAAALVACTGATSYQPRREVSGTIRIWGLDTMRGVVERLAEGFRRHHPRAAFELTLKGSATAIPGLYSGKADLALMARPNYLVDDNGFGRVKQYKPLRLELMNGSLAEPGKADALVVFVHRANPLRRLTLAQLDSIVGCERRRGGRPVHSWGDLVGGDAWQDKPIALHTYDAATGTGIFFQQAVMKDSRKMQWERVSEYRNARNPDGTKLSAADQIAGALRRNRYAIGIGSLRYAHPDLRPVALAADSEGPFVQASAASIVSRSYPLARRTYAFVDRKPGQPIEPKVAEFLHYVLSDEGQAVIAGEGGFLPLDHASRAAQRALVESR